MHARPEFVIRRQILNFLNTTFDIYDGEGKYVLCASQKGFKFREEIDLSPARDRSRTLMSIRTDQVIDFSATYSVYGTDGVAIGTLTRKGFKSAFVADEWDVRDKTGQPDLITEESTLLAFLRRFVPFAAFFLPQTYHMTIGPQQVATLQQHFNPIVMKMSVHMDGADAPKDQKGLALAAAILLMAIDKRQNES
ncbi:MAG: hypothetical protein JKP92_01805 [Alphaproteobacteria bacterium]|jgi:hypothetical protein|nr:hypothetical protein [Alphaproteobacteria bacterium]